MATHSQCQPRPHPFPCSSWRRSHREVSESTCRSRHDTALPPPPPFQSASRLQKASSGTCPLPHTIPRRQTLRETFIFIILQPNKASCWARFRASGSERNLPKRQKGGTNRRGGHRGVSLVFVIRIIYSASLLECPYYSRCTLDEPIPSVRKMDSARLTDSHRHWRPLRDVAVVLKWRR